MIRELGKGAMGVVYLGRDPVIGRLVALKTIRAVSEDDVEQKEFQERFLREAQAAGILSHPNIVTVHDVGEDAATSTSFIAMEYVEGKNLKQLVTEKTTFGFERIAEIIGQVAEALDYAHRRGIVHRDVKPANIIITPEGQVKITDFGIAKIEKSNLTTTGQFLGTPNYMSPEQVTGDAVDGRSDLFSLGVVLYELLTRKKPFTAENLTSISYKIVHERFVPPETYDAGIPSEFAGVLDRALAKDPAERFQRGNDFALALFEFKAREEERQMLRDLGQMVAEAEKLGPVATVTAPPTTLSGPATAMPEAPAAARSPFDILAMAPAAAAAPVPPAPDDDLATREVVRPLPATAYVAGLAPSSPGTDSESRSGGSEEWQLDEPTRSKKKSAPPPPPPVAGDVDVEASLPGAEVVEAAPAVPVAPLPPSAPPPAVAGLAVSPFDEAPPERRPEGATEILRIDAIPGLTAAPAGDRPTEILKPIAPPGPMAPAPPPAVPPPVADRPTEILRVVPPPSRVEVPPTPTDQPTEILRAVAPPPVSAPAVPAAAPPAPAAPSPAPFVDRPTEILKPIAPPAPAAPPPAPFGASIPAPGGSSAPVGSDRPTEILRTPFPPPGPASAARPPVPRPTGDAAGEEGATERIVDAMKLARAGGPAAPVSPMPPPPTVAAPKGAPAPASPPKGVPAPATPPRGVPAPPSAALPPVELAPIPEPHAALPAPPTGPVMKRPLNLRFVALIIGLVAIGGAVVTGVLWSQKKKVEAQAAVNEIREREVQEEKALMVEGTRLLDAGQPTAALEKFRELIRRKPDSEAVRAAIAKAEELARAQQSGEALSREIETLMATAREATELGEFDRALDQLAQVLLLQPENAEALALRDSVNTAQAEQTAAQKKAAAAEAARRRRPTPVPTPVPVARATVPAEVPRAPTPTPGVARLRIIFQSPAPEGYVMIRRDDKEVFRRNFDFGRKSAGGLVEGTIEVPAGSAAFKAWAIPTNRSFNGYEAVDLVIPGGETRTLLLELNAEKKLVVRLR
ncbi:MAG TPA: protein kinase [Thermoanaerobaculia bacterium]|nr:protein kinase [Thermoanaerobaculia bacterium]